MNKTVAIVLTVVTIFLCGCPGLLMLVSFIYSFFTSPEAALDSLGVVSPGGDLALYMWGARILIFIATLVLILIPIIVGKLTLGKKKNHSI
jgi:hypothetical protein